ncbi:hypothetical protein B0H14DRAFT_2560606 [Mycena olivaceomarginata]|nr:hypothetical protein B0H14DRAFT_2560606 [Mycena olivaceomarginata]
MCLVLLVVPGLPRGQPGKYTYGGMCWPRARVYTRSQMHEITSRRVKGGWIHTGPHPLWPRLGLQSAWRSGDADVPLPREDIVKGKHGEGDDNREQRARHARVKAPALLLFGPRGSAIGNIGAWTWTATCSCCVLCHRRVSYSIAVKIRTHTRKHKEEDKGEWNDACTWSCPRCCTTFPALNETLSSKLRGRVPTPTPAAPVSVFVWPPFFGSAPLRWGAQAIEGWELCYDMKWGCASGEGELVCGEDLGRTVHMIYTPAWIPARIDLG